MDKLFRDMEALCEMTAKEREESYRKSCKMAEVSEILLSDDEIVCDGGLAVRVPMEWMEQQLTDKEMALIKARDDQGSRLKGKHQNHMLFIIDEGDIISNEMYEGADSIPFHDREAKDPCYGKTCNETFDEILQNWIDELQDMVELFEYMDMAEDKDMNDILNLLEANISAYNEGKI